MNSTRKILDNITPLYKVTPTKSLLITSMPCEEITANIRNQTVDNMQNYDIAAVAYRFLQSRRGENITFWEAISWIVLTIIFNEYAKRFPLAYFLLLYSLSIPPNICNTLRHGETKRSCEKWLTAHLGKESVNEIRNLKFTFEGITTLSIFLKQKEIDTTFLDGRENKKPHLFSCFDMDI